jgi:hypothetical protein
VKIDSGGGVERTWEVEEEVEEEEEEEEEEEGVVVVVVVVVLYGPLLAGWRRRESKRVNERTNERTRVSVGREEGERDDGSGY